MTKSDLLRKSAMIFSRFTELLSNFAIIFSRFTMLKEKAEVTIVLGTSGGIDTLRLRETQLDL